jgi:hypothetical protein
MKHSACREVVLSEKAHTALVAETYERIQTETGGVFLGSIHNGVWYVVETLDPGPNSIFQVSYFEYDTPYVNHLANKVARFYREPIEVLGLWHRHPGSMDVFSSTDSGTNQKYANLRPEGAISALVNVDPDLRITMYHVSPNLQYTRVKYHVGNTRIPEQWLRRKTAREFTIPMRQTMHVSAPRQPKSFLPFGSAPPVSKTPSVRQEKALDMLEQELPYLENQIEYAYEMEVRDDAVVVTMDYTGNMEGYARRLEFVFQSNDQGEYVSIDNKRYPYRPGIIEQTINKIINKTLSGTSSQQMVSRQPAAPQPPASAHTHASPSGGSHSPAHGAQSGQQPAAPQPPASAHTHASPSGGSHSPAHGAQSGQQPAALQPPASAHAQPAALQQVGRPYHQRPATTLADMQPAHQEALVEMMAEIEALLEEIKQFDAESQQRKNELIIKLKKHSDSSQPQQSSLASLVETCINAMFPLNTTYEIRVGVTAEGERYMWLDSFRGRQAYDRHSIRSYLLYHI